MAKCDVVVRLGSPSECGQPAVAEPAVLFAVGFHRPMILPRYCLEHEKSVIRWGLPVRPVSER